MLSRPHWNRRSGSTDPGASERRKGPLRPLADLLASFVEAGLVLERVCEGGGLVPWRLGLAATKAAAGGAR
jgi:hypothetical protein